MADPAQSFAAPIQLTSYLLQHVELETHPEVSDAPERVPPSISLDTPWNGTLPTADGPSFLSLRVRLNEGVDDWQMYRGHFLLQGRFQWIGTDHEVDPARFTRFYLASGYSMLYGLIRSLLMQLSASSPHPRILLPSISFSPVVEHLLQTRTSDSGDSEG